MNQTISHRLPLLAAAQAQKEVTHNEALQIIDRRLQIMVESRYLEAPPRAPETGTRFIVPSNATGSWAGLSDQIAGFDGFGWIFDTPQPGWLAWVADEKSLVVYDGGWSALTVTARPLATGSCAVAAPYVAAPSGGAVIDTESRVAINSILAALRSQGLIQ